MNIIILIHKQSFLLHDICKLCERHFYSNEGRFPVSGPTKHHLIPKQKYRGRVKDAKYELICETCHKQINKMFTNNELKALNTIAKLKKHPKMQKYLKWIRKK